MTRFEQLLKRYADRWPLTREAGNSLRLVSGESVGDGESWIVYDDRAGGQVNCYYRNPTWKDLIGEMDFQEEILRDGDSPKGIR